VTREAFDRAAGRDIYRASEDVSVGTFNALMLESLRSEESQARGQLLLIDQDKLILSPAGSGQGLPQDIFAIRSQSVRSSVPRCEANLRKLQALVTSNIPLKPVE
jgi:hypothetical protein